MSDRNREPAVRWDELAQQIQEANYLYYVLAQPRLSDGDYDRRFRELQELEAAHPELRRADSPTQRVGGPPLDSLQKFEHPTPMLSLQNSYDSQEIRDFDERVRRFLGSDAPAAIDYVVEPKLDGIAMELIYEGGVLAHAVTRGDGRVGEEVTENVRTIRNLPLRLRPLAGSALPGRIAIRGEVLMPHEGFDALNKSRLVEGSNAYVNPRNATSGTVRNLDPRIAARSPLRFYAHSAGVVEGQPVRRHSDFLGLAEGFGFQLAEGMRTCSGIDAVLEALDAIEALRPDLPYAIDGAVVKVDEHRLQEELGFVSRSPRWAMAFKFAAEQAVTRLLRIDIQVGRTGTLTPVARLEPIFVGGVVVSNATLHNRDEIERKDIRIGDWVVIQRAGDVIPQVVQSLPERRAGDEEPFDFPGVCPECRTSVVELEDAVAVRCPNAVSCPAQLRTGIEHFASRRALDIEGLGEKLVRQLVDVGLLTSVADLYRLETRRDEVIALERMAEKSADNLLQSIDVSRKAPSPRILFGLGIRHVGEEVAKRLCSHFGVWDALQQAPLEELEAVDEVGPVVASALRAWFDDERNQRLIQGLREGGVVFPDEERVAVAEDAPFVGKIVVVTGTLGSMTRGEAKAAIVEGGGKSPSSVSAKTDYLVCGESAGSKVKKAQDLGVATLDEAAFLAMLGRSGD